MKIRSKLIMIATLPVVLLLALTYVFLTAANEVAHSNYKAIVADEIKARIAELSILTYERYIYSEERAHVQWQEKHAALGKQLKAQGAIFDEVNEVESVGRLLRTHRNIGYLFEQYGPHSGGGRSTPESDQDKGFRNRITARLLQELAVAAPVASKLHDLNHDHSLALSQRIDVASVIVVGLITVTLLTISFLVIRAFSVPVRVLNDAFARVSAGDLSCRINSQARDELGALSQAFDAMAQRLADGDNSLRLMNLELEQRIEERTRELSAANEELTRLIEISRAAEQRIKLNEERLAALLDLSRIKFASETELLRHGLEEAVRLTRSKVGYLHFFDEGQQTLGLFLWSQAVMAFCTAAKTPHYPLAEAGVWADCVRKRQPVIHNDYPHLANRKGYPEGHFPLLRHLSVPIFEEERIVAVIGVGNKEEAYDDTDTRQLTLYMRSTWEIVKRKRAEILLADSEIRYRTIFTESPDGIVLIDIETAMAVEFNAAAHRQLGYSREEFAQLTVADYEAKELPEEIGAYFARTNGLGREEFDTLHRTKSGEIRNVVVSKQVLTLGERQYLYAIFRDVTELRQAQEERKQNEEALQRYAISLERSNEELEHFAYVASHDLQEPLRKIGSFSELLARKYQDRLDEKAGTYISYIVDGAHRMQGLINDLLSFSRVATKGRAFSAVNCNEVMGRVRQDMEVAIQECGARLLVDDLPTVMADNIQLGQVFQNLIGNAIKYRNPGAGPEIRVESRKSGNEWVFAVSDNGIGIDPQHFERIFQLFQRLHTREEFSGSGIGLALCKKIVERHGGRIWVESTPGSGSTFFFTLPVPTA